MYYMIVTQDPGQSQVVRGWIKNNNKRVALLAAMRVFQLSFKSEVIVLSKREARSRFPEEVKLLEHEVRRDPKATHIKLR